MVTEAGYQAYFTSAADMVSNLQLYFAWSTSGLFTDATDSAGSFTSTRSPHDDGSGFSAPTR